MRNIRSQAFACWCETQFLNAAYTAALCLCIHSYGFLTHSRYSKTRRVQYWIDDPNKNLHTQFGIVLVWLFSHNVPFSVWHSSSDKCAMQSSSVCQQLCVVVANSPYSASLHLIQCICENASIKSCKFRAFIAQCVSVRRKIASRNDHFQSLLQIHLKSTLNLAQMWTLTLWCPPFTAQKYALLLVCKMVKLLFFYLYRFCDLRRLALPFYTDLHTCSRTMYTYSAYVHRTAALAPESSFNKTSKHLLNKPFFGLLLS